MPEYTDSSTQTDATYGEPSSAASDLITRSELAKALESLRTQFEASLLGTESRLAHVIESSLSSLQNAGLHTSQRDSFPQDCEPHYQSQSAVTDPSSPTAFEVLIAKSVPPVLPSSSLTLVGADAEFPSHMKRVHSLGVLEHFARTYDDEDYSGIQNLRFAYEDKGVGINTLGQPGIKQGYYPVMFRDLSTPDPPEPRARDRPLREIEH